MTSAEIRQSEIRDKANQKCMDCETPRPTGGENLVGSIYLNGCWVCKKCARSYTLG